MSGGGGDGGCGCLILVALAVFFLGGGTLAELVALLGVGWLGYLVFLGVSVGIVVLIAGLIAGR
ncbi:MAG: hypothetical protein GX575_29330 [Candidatus Anammoximicrobium sp.]|nr:hypothetical protein [Candidatus Anammoximicrobium sp.]